MAKNIFVVINSESKIWVDIFKTKYKGWHPCDIPTLPSSSWYDKSISNSASLLKANFKILSRNSFVLDLRRDHCILDLSIIHKPTFLNMSLPLDNVSFVDILDNNSFNTNILENIFGNDLNWDWVRKIKIDSLTDKFWVWGPQNIHTSIASSIYTFLKCDYANQTLLIGWHSIWNLIVMPRIKTFVWKLAHGKLVTDVCLYILNSGSYA